MAVSDVTREAVLSAIAEHDEAGQDLFLDRYGFGPARVYELIHDGRRYDSKAIVGVAHRYATGAALRSQDFSGGEQTVVRQLQRLNFEVQRRAAPHLGESMQRVLDLAGSYSKEATPEMLARDEATRLCAEAIRSIVDPMANVLALEALDLRVQTGGRQANYSPVPWIRMYSTVNSPSAMSGFYLVYLFAADGSRVYLSLNQGTSEHRSGAMRPVNDRQVLLSRSAEARAALIGMDESSAGRRGHMAINLAWSGLQSVGPESRRRIRNYEDGNILAFEYVSGHLPLETQLTDDLANMLPLLAQLYNAAVDPRALPVQSAAGGVNGAAQAARTTVTRTQGRQLDAATRIAIELHAEDRAVRHWEERDWVVRRVGHLKLGYDLECQHPIEGTLHVEVKGTQTLGEEVTLTPNEVRHNELGERCTAQHALYLVSEIGVDKTDAVRCSGGRSICIWPWRIDAAALTPTQYAYRVPGLPPS